MKIRSSAASLLILAVCSSSVLADMLDVENMAPWETCALCHSADGVSVMDKFPKLAGQKPTVIVKQLQDFASGRRANDGGQMRAVSTQISPAELDAIAQYFSQLPPPTAGIGSSDEGANGSHGRTLFTRARLQAPACASCHQSPASDAPWLFAQHRAYIKKQLADFQLGLRVNDGGMHQRMLEKGWSDADFEALAGYLETLQPRALSGAK